MLEIFKKKSMVVLISVLWGLGLATFFASISSKRNCIIVRGELPSEIQQKIFQYPDIQDKCYQYSSYLHDCPNELHPIVKIDDSLKKTKEKNKNVHQTSIQKRKKNNFY